MMNIRAAVAREAGMPFSLENVRLTDIREDEVLVRIVATGMCHTDLGVLHQYIPLPLPWVLGHEGAGVVEQVGASISRLVPGDHVVLTYNSCGSCERCTDNHSAYCDCFAALNYRGRRADGTGFLLDDNGSELSSGFFCQSSFASHAIVHARNAIKVPKTAPLETLGPFGCGFQTGAGAVLNVIIPRQNALIAIFGAGAVGFSALFACKMLGCERVIVVDRVPARLELARELGADHVIDSRNGDLLPQLAEIGPLDFALETTGVPAVAEAAVAALRTKGTYVMLGVSAQPTMSVPMAFMIGGREIKGVRMGDSDPKNFIPFLISEFEDGRFPIDRLCKFYDFADINQAVEDTKGGKTIKPILRF